MIRLRLLTLLLCLWSPAAQAAQPLFDMAAFTRIPVLHEGRVKPLDSFARIHLQRFYGHDRLPDMSASAWLAECLFRPDLAATRPIFHVRSQPVLQSLALPTKPDALYAFDELAPAFEKQSTLISALLAKQETALSPAEKEVLDVYADVDRFSQIIRSFTLILPSSIPITPDLARMLGLDAHAETNYLELVKAKPALTALMTRIVKSKGSDIARYTAHEKRVATLAYGMANLEATGRHNDLLRLFPSIWEQRGEWYAAWPLVLEGHGSPQTASLLALWEELALAYDREDTDTWRTVSAQIAEQSLATGHVDRWRITLERGYNIVHPISKISALYGIIFLLTLLAVATRHARALPAAYYLAGVTLALHASMIAARILILGRPPVSSLYESILFVSLIAAALSLRLNRTSRLPEGLLISSFLGGTLLTLSYVYAARGDSMGMLIAVLNTQFWLATHVICITIGYGCALACGTLAHLYLLKPNATSEKTLQTAALIALLFTAFGTILGGIWADQSWGRFWGWDPKENGALMIVLWLVWILHGKLSGHLKAPGFTGLLAATNIVVALSWFGVNLLNVGLHSYGFTDAAALGLLTFCLGELLVIGWLYRHRKHCILRASHAL